MVTFLLVAFIFFYYGGYYIRHLNPLIVFCKDKVGGVITSLSTLGAFDCVCHPIAVKTNIKIKNKKLILAEGGRWRISTFFKDANCKLIK